MDPPAAKGDGGGTHDNGNAGGAGTRASARTQRYPATHDRREHKAGAEPHTWRGRHTRVSPQRYPTHDRREHKAQRTLALCAYGGATGSFLHSHVPRLIRHTPTATRCVWEENWIADFSGAVHNAALRLWTIVSHVHLTSCATRMLKIVCLSAPHSRQADNFEIPCSGD